MLSNTTFSMFLYFIFENLCSKILKANYLATNSLKTTKHKY